MMIRRLITLMLTGMLGGMLSGSAAAQDSSDLVIAEKGSNDCQIVIPAGSNDEIVDHWLLISAKLMQAAFDKNGFQIDIVKEDVAPPGKHGIYLGATEFAKKNGIIIEPYDDWTYPIKAVGRDLLIAGNAVRG